MSKSKTLKIYKHARIAHEILLRFMRLPETLPIEITAVPTSIRVSGLDDDGTATYEHYVFEWKKLTVECVLACWSGGSYDVTRIEFLLKANTVEQLKKDLSRLSHQGIWCGKPKTRAPFLSSKHPALHGRFGNVEREFFFAEIVIEEHELKEKHLPYRLTPE